MGEALIGAILQKKLLSPSQIGLFDADLQRMKQMRKKHGIATAASNVALVHFAETILLAVKPQQMTEVLEEISPHIQKNHLILSIAAGLDTDFLAKRLPRGTRLIRVMPNLCALIGEGATALYVTTEATRKDRKFAERIFSAAGIALWVEREEWLDAVTAVSGSGPAFVFYLMESLTEAGEREGLPHELCRRLVLQTLAGATKMAESSIEPFPGLIEKVTSKGGTTEAGLKVLKDRGFREILIETIQTATQRARELRG